jgi:FixJ family two-component response regulator
MPAEPIIHIVDDDDSFRSAIARLLRASGYEVRTYSNAGDFLLADAGKVPGCILLDIHMPGPSGLDLQAALVQRQDLLPIIFVSGKGDIPGTVRAMKAGATDFLVKPVKKEALLNAIEEALARDARQRAAREHLSHLRACFGTLTAREHEVFERVVTGKMNKEIADELGAAERTIKAHRANVMQKMRVASLAELVQAAEQLRNGAVHFRTPLPGETTAHS